MKKFFTLCLAFMLASLLNVNAQTYSLVGSFNNWNVADTKYDFSTNGDAWTLTGIDLPANAEFKVVKNHSWDVSYGGYIDDGKGDCTLPKDIPYVLGTGSDNLKVTSALSNCTLTFSFVNNKAVLLLETDSYYYLSSKNWGIIGNDAIVGSWGTDVDMTYVSTGVYEWWTETLPQGGFKVRADDSWDFSFGTITSNAIEVGKKYNLLMNGGDLTIATPSESYSKYCFRLCALGGAATLEVIGYKNAAPAVDTTTIELTASAQGYTNAQEVASVSDPTNTIKVEFNKGTNSNTCKYYDTGDAVRVYGGGYFTITASTGENITAIELSFGTGDGSNVLSADSGTLTNNVWSGSAKSVKFNVGGTSGHRRIQKIKVTQGEGEIPAWAPVISGVSNGGLFYGNQVSYSIDAPGADKVDVEFYKNSKFDWNTSLPSTYLPYQNSASCAMDDNWNNITTEHEIIATAWKGNEYYTTVVKFTLQPVAQVTKLADFIGAEGKRMFVQQMATVTYQYDKYLYLKDSYDGAIVVYGDGLPTFAQGDLLQNFIAEYENYNGLHEIVPLASSFENARLGNWGAPEPKVITIDDVTVANQNKYVKLNGVALDNTAMTIGGVKLYNRFNVELPADGKYNVVAIVSYYNNTGVTDDAASVQLYPISFEEVPELVPSTVTPADGATVSSLSFVTLTFPEYVSVNSNAGSITCTGENDNKANVAVTVENEKVVLELAETSDYWAAVTYTITIPAGYFTTASGKTNSELTFTYTISDTASYELNYSSVTPAAGQVESISEISFIFPEWVKNYFSAEKATLKDADGNVVAQSTEYSRYDAEGNFNTKLIRVVLDKTVTAPGTYTLTVPQGAINDRTADFSHSRGNQNPEFNITYTIPEPPITYTYLPKSVTPADGSVVDAPLKSIRLAMGYDTEIKGGAYSSTEYISIVNQNGERVFEGTARIELETQYYYYIYIYPNGDEGITEPGTYTFTIPAGSIGNEDIYYSRWKEGKVNPELTFTYTIKAPAMQVSAVAPEEGTEVESLDVITLTFPEATTFAAEASALTFSVTNYYKASVQSVEMSADGLTATITSTANYPGWVVGENYTLNIPAGAFVGASGAATEALSYTWTIAAEKFTYVSVTPAQGIVTELSEILICFPNKAYGNNYTLPTLNLIDEYGAVITTASTVRAQDADGNWYAIKATLKDKVTAAGTYILQVPEDVFKDTDFGDGNTNKAFNLKWTIDSNTYTLAIKADPADGATVTTLDKISLSAATAGVIAMPTTEAQSAGWFSITDAEGNSYNYTAKVGVGLDLTIEGATAAGTYTVVVPAKSFVDAMTMAAASKNYNAEMILTYTVDANKYDLAWTVNPAEGEVTELTKLVFKAANASEMAYPTNQALSDNWVKVTDAEGNVYNTTAKAGQGYDVTIEGVSAPGTYTVVVPKGSFYDMMASMTGGTMNFNDEIVLTYTIATPEDFTPVVTPTAGTVKAEDLATIVVTLPSEFGEFNPKCDTWYDQMYFKFYSESAGYEQTLWLNTKSSITVSEDGLSITLTDWAFEFEKGVTYKFNIPAGYIVLANGAKNAETCIEYVVDQGPKDMAEFIVPEGINGYINYDETNINAWTPEFPFTVSTTQNNTIAFSATLPSLPTGLTSMEVLDENGEVLVTLNQTGVAPLADGTEEYYVAGETTKEFVDGATLRFYFSFAHAGGISETIRFEYVVAGGTITGAEAITLDGNVIVRGNDIIAPEGSAIYTVSGIQVPAEGLAPGVYVVVYGNQAIKVMVK